MKSIKKIVITLTVFVGMQQINFAAATPAPGGFKAMLMAKMAAETPAEKTAMQAKIKAKMAAATPAEKAAMKAKIQAKATAKSAVATTATTAVAATAA